MLMRKKLDGQSIKIVTDKERLAGLGGSHQDILCVCVCAVYATHEHMHISEPVCDHSIR